MRDNDRNRKKFSISILSAVTVPMVFFVVVITVVVSFISFGSGIRSVRMISGHLRSEVNKRIMNHIQSFLDVPVHVTGAVAQLMEQGYLPRNDQKELDLFFLNLLKLNPTVTSIYFGNIFGGLADAGREDYGGSYYMLETEGFSTGPLTKYAVDQEGRHLETVFRSDHFDARTRPWFRAAVETQGPVWSGPYILATGDKLSISSSRAVYTQEGTFKGVVSVDLFLSHIDSFLSELDVSPGGYVFIQDREGYLVSTSLTALSVVVQHGNGSFHRISTADVPEKSMRQASALLEKNPLSKDGVFDTSFNSDGEHYDILVTALEEKYGLGWKVATVIPETDFTTPVRRNLMTSMGLILLAMIIILLAGWIVTRIFLGPLEKMGELAVELSRANWVRAPDSHWIREIHNLNLAFNDFSKKIEHMVESLNEEVKERKKAEEEIHKLLAEKEILLQEVHHRIKNNMMVVRSLLFLQADSAGNPEARAVLGEAVNRVNVMTEAYEMLNQADGYETIHIRHLLHEVANSLRMESSGRKEMKVLEHIEDLHLPTNLAIHIGIIINELLTNCRKYAASKSEDLTVAITLRRIPARDYLEITVTDSGDGFPEEVLTGKNYGTGLKIVDVLARQHEGEMKISSGKEPSVHIRIPSASLDI